MGFKENEIIRHDPNPDQQCGVAKRSTKGKAYNNKARATKSEQNLLLESKHLRRVSDGSTGIGCTVSQIEGWGVEGLPST
ncbi:hypothetical protein M378DRAFT_169542 [Amanita muscaria Koide BX008]|uniref:Uncharacterized protein n=1 Tax=Amanita muscaria (strain Koide BX008) TaxID=946122 RepID=A0A0C2WSF2_AMAMK|nr:hypothetical protein M378DRAFT_169542 [Amanita muscaria Koide BX008]